MILLASLLWPAMAASLVLGAGIGWLTGPPRTVSARRSAAILAAATGLSGGIAFAGLVPGRAGLWLEGAALVLAAYCVGVGVGAILNRGEMAQSAERP